MEYAWFDAVHTTTESSSSWWKQEDLSSSSFSAVERFLQDDGGTTTTQSDSTILRTTFKVYGSILLVSFILFCFLRQRCPRPYNIRNWVEKIKVRSPFFLFFIQCCCYDSIRLGSFVLKVGRLQMNLTIFVYTSFDIYHICVCILNSFLKTSADAVSGRSIWFLFVDVENECLYGR